MSLKYFLTVSTLLLSAVPLTRTMSVGAYTPLDRIPTLVAALAKDGYKLDFFSEFFPISSGGFQKGALMNFVNVARAADPTVKKIMLTLEPWQGLEVLGDTALANIADNLRQVNQMNISIIVRFAHEMNGAGNYYPWQGNPALYKQKFQEVTTKIRECTTDVKMLYAPLNIYKTLTDESQYYPGDQYVDLVGLTMLPNRDADVVPDMFTTKIRFQYMSSVEQSLRSFVERYTLPSGGHNKPFMIAETANPTPGWEISPDERRWKAQWLSQIIAGAKALGQGVISGTHFMEVTKEGYGCLRNYGFMRDWSLRPTFMGQLKAL